MPGVWTCVLHHPARPVECFRRTLQSLRTAVQGQRHIVHAVVQGEFEPSDHPLPSPMEHAKWFELRYSKLKRNVGVGAGMRLSADAFLKEADLGWFARIDDDIMVPGRAWDIAIQNVIETQRLPALPIGGCMISTGVTRPRLLVFGHRSVDVVDGDRGTRERWLATQLESRWSIVDYVSAGCTVYNVDLLRAGCLPDPMVKLGGEDLDIVMQGRLRGFKWLLATVPTCNHLDAQCRPEGYRQVRRDHALVREVGKYFRKKWGVACPKLDEAGAAGNPKVRKKR